MPRLLSSRLTFTLKYVFPLLWIAGVGLVALIVILDPVAVLIRTGEFPTEAADLWLVTAWAVGTALIVMLVWPLKRVKLEGKTLIVSNFRRDVRVPVTHIETVRQNRWINIRPITVTFRHTTPFGRKIRFMPQNRIRWRFWSESPIVEELRLLGGASSPG